MTYTPFVWLLIVSALINGGLAYYTRKYRDVPSIRPFRFMMWCAALWALLYGVSASLVYFPHKLFIINLIYIPALLSSISFLALALEYTGHGAWLDRRRLAQLLFPPVIFILLAFTSEYHTLWRYNYHLIWSGSVPVIIATKGAVYWIYIAYMLGLSLASFAILITSFRSRSLYFRSTLILITGLLIPVIVGTLYVFGLTPVRGFDWTSTSFIWMGISYLWAVLRGRLFDVTPLARNTLVEFIEDLMIVVNRDGVVVDYNHAAQAAIGLSPSTIGRSPNSLPQPWNYIFQRHPRAENMQEEVMVEDITYNLNITSVRDDWGNITGRIFLFRNISQRKQIELQERKLSRAVEQSPASIIITDLTGQIEYVNRHFTEMTGYGMEEAIGNNPRMLRSGRTPPDTYRQLWEALGSGRQWRGEFINRRKNGDLYHESATISAITDANGNITHYLGVQEDVTDLIQNEARLRYQNDRLNALYNITFDLLKRHKVEDLLDAILQKATDLLASPFGILDSIEGDTLIVKSATEMSAPLLGDRILMEDSPLAYLAVQTREPQVIHDYSEWAKRLRRHDAYQLRAVLNMPIMINDEVVGVISLGRTQPDVLYSNEEIEVMKSFAQLAALAIDNARLFAAAQVELVEKVQAEEDLREANETLRFQIGEIRTLQSKLREQAIRDPLTGLYNRRYLDETLEREISRAARNVYPISFVMIDIDHFKRINDTFGHPAGDAVLQKLAAMLIGQTRIGDIICRYGGEEFLVVLPNVTTDIAYQITERWRLSFMGSTLPLKFGNTRATISCGISVFPEHGNSSADLIALADKAMYRAKQTGRNRVAIWPDHKA
ncbi:MAG TPA: diguanylate cyclase [Anaerolineales bacterium]|nr:diguanylate cyclase [Anaerolineales bacterium]